DAERIADPCGKGQVEPVEVGRDPDAPRSGIDPPRYSNPDRTQPAASTGFVDRRQHRGDDDVDPVVRPAFAHRPNGPREGLPILVHDEGGDLRPADVDADDESLIRHPARSIAAAARSGSPARLRPSSPVMSSADAPRMTPSSWSRPISRVVSAVRIGSAPPRTVEATTSSQPGPKPATLPTSTTRLTFRAPTSHATPRPSSRAASLTTARTSVSPARNAAIAAPSPA